MIRAMIKIFSGYSLWTGEKLFLLIATKKNSHPNEWLNHKSIYEQTMDTNVTKVYVRQKDRKTTKTYGVLRVAHSQSVVHKITHYC